MVVPVRTMTQITVALNIRGLRTNDLRVVERKVAVVILRTSEDNGIVCGELVA